MSGNRGGRAWAALRQRVMERDNWTCVLCGKPAEHVDHIVPVIAGGTDALDNLRALCRDDNLRKGAKTLVREAWYNDKYLTSL